MNNLLELIDEKTRLEIVREQYKKLDQQIVHDIEIIEHEIANLLEAA